MNIKTTHHCTDQNIRVVKKTRKPHRCCECKDVIPLGASCIVASGVSKSGGYSFRWCIPCNLLHLSAREYSRGDNLLFFGKLREFIADLP